MQNPTPNPFVEIIHSYTRAQAIRAGVLIDLSRLDAIQVHWKCPVACTAAVWAVISDAVMRHGQNLEGLMHATSIQIMRAAAQQPGDPVVYFSVLMSGRTCALKAHYGHGDTSENVITVMLPGES